MVPRPPIVVGARRFVDRGGLDDQHRRGYLARSSQAAAYLPSAALIGALVSFAAARTVSLHHIDILLDRRELLDVRLASVVEIELLTAVSVATVVTIFRGQLDGDPAEKVRSPVPPSAALPSVRPTEHDGLGSRRSSGSGVTCNDP